MNQTEHTSMMQLLSIQITGDAEVKSIEKTLSEAKMPVVSQDIKAQE
jgi:chemotaxis receptor (MCP) glutamine deamidase CheD